MADESRLRDADRVLAHSYALEVYERPEPDRYIFRWRDVLGFVIGMVLLYGTVIALVILGTAAQ